ncbi:MAG: phosphodiester glycosidase family protein [Defluviitoga tunisiensis]
MEKIISILLFLLLVTNIFAAQAVFISQSKTPIYIDAIKNQAYYYINVDELAKYDSMVINKTSRIIYVIYKKDVLEISLNDYYSKINFIDKYNDSVISMNGKVYIRNDVLASFLKLQYFENYDNIFFFSSLPQITELKVLTNEISVTFDSYLNELSINLNKISDAGDYLLTIKPVAPVTKIPSNADCTYSNNTFYLRFRSDLKYSLNIEGKSLQVKLNGKTTEDSKQTTQQVVVPKTKDGISYSERIETFNEQRIKIYQLSVDPKKYKLKVDLNNLGTYSNVSTFLKKENPIFSVNASFFDTQTLEPIGNIISEGELLHLSSYSRPALFINDKYEVDIDYVKLEYQIEIDGLLFWVKSVNSNWKGDVKLYTSHYKGKIEETEDSYIFLLFNEKNKLISKNKTIPKEGEKLILIDKKYEKYLSKITTGSEINFLLKKSENIIGNPILLLEGGPILLYPNFTQEQYESEKRSYSNGIIYGKTSRTLVAIDQKDIITFMVIEGYDNPESGLTYDEVRKFLLNIGSYEKAMLLDGGSSSIVFYNSDIQNYKDGKTRNYIPVLLSVYEN